jgi:hypothetical protein
MTSRSGCLIILPYVLHLLTHLPSHNILDIDQIYTRTFCNTSTMKPTELPFKEPPAIPPFLDGNPIDPDTSLAYIQTEISNIYSAAKTTDNDNDQAIRVESNKYIEIYTAVFNFCKEAMQKSQSQPPAKNGEVLYRWLTSEIRSYCKHICGSALSLNNDDGMDVIAARKILTTYIACHHAFVKLSSLVRNLLGFWDRHWMRREHDEKKIPVASIIDLHKVVWKEEILDVDAKNSLSKEGLEKLADAVAILKETQRGMTDYDLALVKDVSKSLTVLDLTVES